MADHDDSSPHQSVREKLGFLKSPLIHRRHHKKHHHQSSDGENLPDLSEFGDRDHPEVQRHDDASILEVFFDLFFAANYTVFAQNQAVTNHARFKSYVGYFCLLWLTWFLITLYDVRFVTDSVFERMARAMQLGVLVGFAVVAPTFDPTNQNMKTMKTMSLILCMSRLVLAIEYGTILWHVRKYRKARLPLYIQTGINFGAAIIYLAISFRFHETRSRVFVTWYVISGLEAIGTIVISNFWPVLSFTKTHLMKRMSLLTVMILGDGIISVATNVVSIVKQPDAWNPTIIGIVTAGTATIYFIFLIYFDWMKADYLPPWRQQLWTCLHLPFNLALVLFMAGFTQFIIWAKIVDAINSIGDHWILWDFSALSTATSLQVQRNLTNLTGEFFAVYPPKYSITNDVVQSAISNITQIPNSFWAQYANFQATGNTSSISKQNAPALFTMTDIITVLFSSMGNAIFESFGIDLAPNVRQKEGAGAAANANSGNFQVTVNEKTWQRYRLVFAYAYISAGVALFLMTLLTVISRVTPWKPWPVIRSIIYTLLALGIGLVSLLFYHPDEAMVFLFSPWVLPTITFLWFAVLLLTHVGNSTPLFFQRRNSKKNPFSRDSRPYVPVEVPLAPWNNARDGVARKTSDDANAPVFVATAPAASPAPVPAAAAPPVISPPGGEADARAGRRRSSSYMSSHRSGSRRNRPSSGYTAGGLETWEGVDYSTPQRQMTGDVAPPQSRGSNSRYRRTSTEHTGAGLT